jgi:hypothetical protein
MIIEREKEEEENKNRIRGTNKQISISEKGMVI